MVMVNVLRGPQNTQQLIETPVPRSFFALCSTETLATQAINIATYLLLPFVRRVHPHRHCCLRQDCLLSYKDLEPNVPQPGISLSDPPKHVSFSCH